MQLEEGPQPGVDVEQLKAEGETVGGVRVQGPQRGPHPPAGVSTCPGPQVLPQTPGRQAVWVLPVATRGHQAPCPGAPGPPGGTSSQGAPTKPSVPGQEGAAAGQVVVSRLQVAGIMLALRPPERARRGGGGGLPLIKVLKTKNLQTSELQLTPL